MEISAIGVRPGVARPRPVEETAPGPSVQRPGQQAKTTVAEARQSGADLPANAQGLAASAIARGAEPSSVFAALVPRVEDEVSVSGSEVAEERAEGIVEKRARGLEEAQTEALADARADDAVAAEEAVYTESVAEDYVVTGEETDALPVVLDSDDTERSAVTDDVDAIGAGRESGESNVIEASPAVPEATPADAPEQPEIEQSEPLSAEPGPPLAADGARGTSALVRAAEAAYTETVAGLQARAQGAAAERVV